MKRFVFLFLLSIHFAVFSQESFDEGVAVASMTMSSNNPEVQGQLAMMGDMSTTTYFKGDKTRSESNNLMAGETITIIDAKAKKMLLLMNNMGGKMYSKKDIAPTQEDLDKMTVEKGTETKTVLGYECQQYFVTIEEGGMKMTSEYFVTDKIQAVSEQFSGYGSKLEGFPLYMVMKMNQPEAEITLTYEIKELRKEEVSDDKFDMTIPEGYTELQVPNPQN